MRLSCHGALRVSRPSGRPFPRWCRERTRLALLLGTLAVGAAPAAHAQTTAPGAAASAPSASPGDGAPSERARRDADKVFHWILIQGDRTRKSSAGAAANTAKEEKPAARAAAPAPAPTTVAAQPVRPAARVEPPPEPVAPAVARQKPEATTLAAAAPTVGPASAAGMPAETSGASASPVAGVPVAAPSLTTQSPGAAAAKPLEGDSAPKMDDRKAETIPAADADAEQDVNLVPVAQPQPQFAMSTMRALRRGTVQVKFTVQPDGSVADLEVMHTTSVRLNAAAMAAVGQWRFQPIARAVTGAVEVGFDLE